MLYDMCMVCGKDEQFDPRARAHTRTHIYFNCILFCGALKCVDCVPMNVRPCVRVCATIAVMLVVGYANGVITVGVGLLPLKRSDLDAYALLLQTKQNSAKEWTAMPRNAKDLKKKIYTALSMPVRRACPLPQQ